MKDVRKVILTVLLAAIFDAAHGTFWTCSSLVNRGIPIRFRCRDPEDEYCLRDTEHLCDPNRRPDCPNKADQWTGLCDNLCPVEMDKGVRINSFKCDGRCEKDFMKWCDGTKDCKSGIDEAHCNCTANPVDCGPEWKDRWQLMDYLKIILPIVVVVFVILLGLVYGYCKYNTSEGSTDSTESRPIKEVGYN